MFTTKTYYINFILNYVLFFFYNKMNSTQKILIGCGIFVLILTISLILMTLYGVFDEKEKTDGGEIISSNADNGGAEDVESNGEINGGTEDVESNGEINGGAEDVESNGDGGVDGVDGVLDDFCGIYDDGEGVKPVIRKMSEPTIRGMSDAEQILYNTTKETCSKHTQKCFMVEMTGRPIFYGQLNSTTNGIFKGTIFFEDAWDWQIEPTHTFSTIADGDMTLTSTKYKPGTDYETRTKNDIIKPEKPETSTWKKNIN